MKKILVALLACAMVFASCKKDPILVGSIKLDRTSASLVEGTSVQLTATVSPADAENKTLNWATSDKAVATVDATGKVQAVAPGEATITVTPADGAKVSATCKITVTKKIILVTGITLNYTESTLKVGEDVQLTAVVAPADATTNTVAWSSDKTGVATVDATGKVVAVAGGTAVITATATDGSGVSATCTVTVKEPKTMFLKFKTAVMRVGGKDMNQSVWYGSADAYGDREDVTSPVWTSANTGVVSNEAAKFTAVAPGETTIKAADADGNEVECAVKVLAPTVKPADYQHGIAIGNLSDNSGWKQKVDGVKVDVDLGAGYVEGGPQKITINVANYKAVEKTWDAAINASAYNDKNPALFVRLYIDDITKFNFDGDGALALSSATTTDDELLRIPWTYIFSNATNADARAKQAVHNGWNNIVIPLDYIKTVNADWNKINLARINNFRLYQNPSNAKTGAKLIIDQLRIVDWTELDNCDNFDMWFDRMTDNNMFLCVSDEADKKEGVASFAVVDHIIAGAVSNYRLEMWPGLESALPVNLDQNTAALKFWLYVSDGEAFKSGIHCVFEVSSELKNDQDNFTWTKLPGDIDFKTGWNEITLGFDTAGGDTRPESKRDLRKINYFRIVFTPQGAPAKAYTYKIDDIRIVKK